MSIEDLAKKVCGFLRTEPEMMALITSDHCDTSISPKTRALIYAGDRTRFAPPNASAPLDIGSLAAQASSAAVDLSTDALGRGFKVVYVNVSGTAYNTISLNIYVGGQLRHTFSGVQLDPATNNGCIAEACRIVVCAGSQESITFTITNTSAAALAATASVRVQGEVVLEGDPGFLRCWGEQCQAHNVRMPAAAAAACGCD